MENMHLKHNENRIEMGIAGLKAQTMPNPPAGLVEQMIAGTPSWTKPWAWKALAACGGLGIVVIAALPRTSAAETSLDHLVQAHSRSDVLFHVTPYWVKGSKRTPKIWRGYVKGNQWHYIQSNYEQACNGIRTLTYFPNEGKAQIWTSTAAEINSKSVLGEASLGWWKSADRKGLSLQRNVKWNGLIVDRYEITTTSASWGPSRNILYADPIQARPLYAESLHASGNGSAIKWDYPNPADEGVLRIQMKSGTKVEDVTAQRPQTAGKAEAPAKAQDGN